MPIHEDVRRRLVRRFPYGVLYGIGAESIRVLAVMHSRRRPMYWVDRELRASGSQHLTSSALAVDGSGPFDNGEPGQPVEGGDPFLPSVLEEGKPLHDDGTFAGLRRSVAGNGVRWASQASEKNSRRPSRHSESFAA